MGRQILSGKAVAEDKLYLELMQAIPKNDDFWNYEKVYTLEEVDGDEMKDLLPREVGTADAYRYFWRREILLENEVLKGEEREVTAWTYFSKENMPEEELSSKERRVVVTSAGIPLEINPEDRVIQF